MEALKIWFEKFEKCLPKSGLLADLLNAAEVGTGVERVYIAAGAIVTVVLWLMFGWGGQLVSNTLGFAYPAYCSIKALESSEMEVETQWLTYWLVFSFFSVIEFFSDILIDWVPFYWFSKCLFLCWCMAPVATNGSSVIYQRLLRPIFNSLQTKMDVITSKTAEKTNSKTEEDLVVEKINEKAD